MRISLISALMLALLAFTPFLTEAQSMSNSADSADTRMQALLEWSMQNKRGISVHLQGDVIHGVVKELLADGVVLANQERATIIVRRERITAIAGQ